MMKIRIIDILDKIANGTLEDGFKFKYNYKEFYYDKKNRDILSKEDEDLVTLDEYIFILGHLADEVEVIEDVKKIEPLKVTLWIDSKNKEILQLEELIHSREEKINELVQAVNELNKQE